MKLPVINLLKLPEADLGEEFFETLLQRPGLKVERIISSGQATPAGQWYDQAGDEWVLLLSGEAWLQIEGESEARRLLPGDALLLPAHCRHRVAWTAPDKHTVWLALHLAENGHAPLH
jgi:cupin 2 domain-containing protein